jgi:hypothetical protein
MPERNTMSSTLEPQKVASQEAGAKIIQDPAGSIAAPAVEETEQVVRSQAGVERHERVVTNAAGAVEHRESLVHNVATEHLMKVAKACQLVWLVAAIIDVTIGLRVLLKLIGANPGSGFASFAYNVASPFLAPFFGLTGSPAAGGSVLEVPSVIAILFYAFVAWGVVRIIGLLFDQPATRSSSTYDRSRV